MFIRNTNTSRVAVLTIVYLLWISVESRRRRIIAVVFLFLNSFVIIIRFLPSIRGHGIEKQ